MPRPRRFHRLVLCRITRLHRQRFLPVLPILVLEQDRNRRPDGQAVVDTGQNMRSVGLNLHATPAPVTLLPPPEFPIDELLVYRQSGGQTRQKCDQRLAVRFSGSEIAQHKQLILTDQMIRQGYYASLTKGFSTVTSGPGKR